MFKSFLEPACRAVTSHPVAGAADGEVKVAAVHMPLAPAKDSYIINNFSSIEGDAKSQPSFVVKYDSRTRVPKYVMEHISNRQQPSIPDNRKHLHFFPEPSIDIEAFQVRPDDYTNTGYDRGHLAASANHKTSTTTMKSTFTMANVCPQDVGFNRGYWLKLEDWVRSLTKHRDGNDLAAIDVVVVSGPAFLPSYVNGEWVSANRIIGSFPRWIQVPTHFFKVVLKISRTEQDVLQASNNKVSLETYTVHASVFLLPNKNIDTKLPLECFAVPIRDLEALVGMTFFDLILTENSKIFLDNKASQLPLRENKHVMIELANGNLSATSELGLFKPPVDESSSNPLVPVSAFNATTRGGSKKMKGNKRNNDSDTINVDITVANIDAILDNCTSSDDTISEKYNAANIIRNITVGHLCSNGGCVN